VRKRDWENCVGVCRNGTASMSDILFYIALS